MEPPTQKPTDNPSYYMLELEISHHGGSVWILIIVSASLFLTCGKAPSAWDTFCIKKMFYISLRHIYSDR